MLRPHRIPQLSSFHFRLIASEKLSHRWELPHLSELLVLCSLLVEPTSSVLTVNFPASSAPASEDELGSKDFRDMKASTDLWLNAAGPYAFGGGDIASGRMFRKLRDQYTRFFSRAALCSHLTRSL